MLRTRHEHTLEWGEWPVEKIEFVESADIFAWSGLRGTGDHRVWFNGCWQRLRDIGEPSVPARVAKITVAVAHTYVSAGILSHNVKA